MVDFIYSICTWDDSAIYFKIGLGNMPHQIIQEDVDIRLQDLTYSKVAGHHFIRPQPNLRIINPRNMRRNYSFRDYDKNGCFVIYVGKDIMAKVVEIEALLEANPEMVSAYMWPIFNTLEMTKEAKKLIAQLKKEFPTKGDPRARLDHGRNQWIVFAPLTKKHEKLQFYLLVRSLVRSFGESIERLVYSSLAPPSLPPFLPPFLNDQPRAFSSPFSRLWSLW